MSIDFNKKWETTKGGKPRPKALDDNYSAKNKPKEQEKRVARRVGGHRQPASGAFTGMKGDVKSKRFLFDAKRTKFGSMAITVDWLRKISREAEDAGKIPALSLEWEETPMHIEKDWVVVPMYAFEELTKR